MDGSETETEFDQVSIGPDHTSLGWYVLTLLVLLGCGLWLYASPVYIQYILRQTRPSSMSPVAVSNVKPNGSIPGRGKNELAVVFFNVRYGDGILIQAPDGTMTLIDGGQGRYPENKNAPPMDFAHRLYIPFFRTIDRKKLNNVISTVPFSHHMGVIPDLIASRSVKVERLYHSGYPARFYNYRRMMVLAKKNGLKISELSNGDRLDLGSGVKTAVVHARQDVKVKSKASRVLLIKYGTIRFLLMSDLPVKEESKMVLKWGDSVKADVLKVGRHGGSDATSRNLIKHVDPKYAVISVNKKNPLGAPAKEVLKRFKQFNTESILRTDKSGHIAMYTDGQDIRVTKGAFQFLDT